MKIDKYQLEIELARIGKDQKDLGVDVRTMIRAKSGKEVKPITVHKIAAALGVDPERITKREVTP